MAMDIPKIFFRFYHALLNLHLTLSNSNKATHENMHTNTKKITHRLQESKFKAKQMHHVFHVLKNLKTWKMKLQSHNVGIKHPNTKKLEHHRTIPCVIMCN
jgi:hypothetical protein